MTQQELQEIEERWKFGTNTREDVRFLLDNCKDLLLVALKFEHANFHLMKRFGVKSVNLETGEIETKENKQC